MAKDDNIVDFGKRKKAKAFKEAAIPKQEYSDKQKFHVNVARQLIEKDPLLQRVFQKLGLGLEDASSWLLAIAELRQNLDKLVYDTHEKADFNPVFGALIAQALAMASSDELTTIGFSGDFDIELFRKFKANALKTIAMVQHIDEIPSEPQKGPDYTFNPDEPF